jgi:hypothetical protein
VNASEGVGAWNYAGRGYMPSRYVETVKSKARFALLSRPTTSSLSLLVEPTQTTTSDAYVLNTTAFALQSNSIIASRLQ